MTSISPEASKSYFLKTCTVCFSEANLSLMSVHICRKIPMSTRLPEVALGEAGSD